MLLFKNTLSWECIDIILHLNVFLIIGIKFIKLKLDLRIKYSYTLKARRTKTRLNFFRVIARKGIP